MLSKKLKNARLNKNMSEKELAEKSGITERSIRYIESGFQKNPQLNTLQRLSNALDVSIEELIK